jgi:YD repeat-containing protein
VEILTPKGSSIKLTYDDQSRIIRSENNQGQWARYQYARDGLLSDVVFSSGAERHYSYAGVQMTLIKDQHGRVLLHNHYVDRMLSRQDFANGTSCYYRYEMAPNGSYVESVAVTLPNGNITTVHPADTVAELVKNPR